MSGSPAQSPISASSRSSPPSSGCSQYFSPPSASKHGYAMIEEIERISGARLGPGTLYGAITRLEQQGLIEQLAVEERRQPYRLTAMGRRALRTKLVAMRQVALAGLKKL